MKYLLFLSLIFFATTAYAGTPLDSTAANIGIGKIFDTSGRVQRLIVSPGSEAQVRSDLGVIPSDSPVFTGTVTAPAATIAGVSAPYIAQTNGTGTGITLAGTSTFPSGVWGSTGNVGIGTTTPSTQLHTTGSVRLATLGSGAVQSDANGNLSVSSDERLKIIQGMFMSSLEAILGIEPILYKYNELSGLDQGNVYAGFSAQNVMQYIPEAVGIDSRGYYSFNDRPVIAALVNAVKELKKEIEELQKINNIILKSYNAPAHNYKTRTIKTKTIKY